jgi:hypothetical protein
MVCCGCLLKTSVPLKVSQEGKDGLPRLALGSKAGYLGSLGMRLIPRSERSPDQILVGVRAGLWPSTRAGRLPNVIIKLKQVARIFFLSLVIAFLLVGSGGHLAEQIIEMKLALVCEIAI